jgi:HTH-type transcriptional regulator, sugar sensing transcriptional regulator
MDSKILEDIGLTEGETKVYLALIHLGQSTSGPITDKSGVSRSKIYNILERLIQKGFVSYIIKEKTRHYLAEDPVKIRGYLDRREDEFASQRKEIDKLIPRLELQKQLEKTRSEAQIYKGFKGVQAITDHVYSRLRKGDLFYNIGVPSYQEDIYHAYWHKDHLRRIKAGIKCKLLFNIRTPKEVLKNRNSYKDCEARYMPIRIETPTWILVYKDVSVIIMQGDETMAIEIVNKQIADSFKQYFEAFWAVSKPFKG